MAYPECVTKSKSGNGDDPPGALCANALALSNPDGLAGLGAKFGLSIGDGLLCPPPVDAPPVDLDRTEMFSL